MSIPDAKVWLSFGKAPVLVVLVVHCIFGFKDQLIKTYKYRRLVAPFDINNFCGYIFYEQNFFIAGLVGRDKDRSFLKLQKTLRSPILNTCWSALSGTEIFAAIPNSLGQESQY